MINDQCLLVPPFMPPSHLQSHPNPSDMRIGAILPPGRFDPARASEATMVRNVEPAPPTGPALQIALAQQISVRTIPLLERQLDDAFAQRASSVELIAGSVQVVDSAGLNWLLNAKTRVEALGASFKINDPSPVLIDAFTATRL